MDTQGNIGLGYTIVNTNQVPQLKFTGRLASDPLNQMTITAQPFFTGGTSSVATRYGDYSQLTVDPSDDKTFWFIGERFAGNNRICHAGVFKFASDFNNDLGVSNITAPTDGILSANETITVSITNYGLQDQSNFPIQYQVNGGNAVTENYTGTVTAGATVSFTFSTTYDMSTTGDYTITATTNLASDQDNSNDSATITVTHLLANDMGVTNILTPQSATGLSANESVQVVIKNFGGQTQSNVPVSYTLDGNTVNETAPGPFAPNSEQNYTFSQTGDFSALGNHNLSASTQLTNDQDTSNDSFSATITNQMCQPSGNCSLGDEISRIQFNTIDNSSGCSSTGYEDFTNISTILVTGQSYDFTITVGYGEEYVTAWIDYNDNFIFEDTEKIILDQQISPSGGPGTYSETYSVNIPASANHGEHLMRVRINWQNPVADACTDVTYGETEDYKVWVSDNAGINNELAQANIVIQTISDNHFFVTLENTKSSDDLLLQVFTTSGQEIVYHKLRNKNGKYTYDLDMQYVAKGVYLLRIGNDKGGKIKKIIVK
jgi:hypothetical protein